MRELRKQGDRVGAGRARMQQPQKRRDFAVAHSTLRAENARQPHRLDHFQTRAPDKDMNVQKCLSQALHAIKMIDDKIK